MSRGPLGRRSTAEWSLACVLEPRVLLAFAPVGEPALANTTFPFFETHPSVAADADGDFVVVWERRSSSDGPGDIYGRRFDREFVPRGDEFLINTTTFGNQLGPKVAMDADGDFVVTWYDDTLAETVWARRFNAAGAPAGPEFQIGMPDSQADAYPSVAMDPAGNFVIAWEADIPTNPPEPYIENRVYARRFAADGSVRGPDVRVNVGGIVGETWPALAMDRDGDFVVAWHEVYTGSKLVARRFDAGGRPLTGPLIVSDAVDQPDVRAAVAMDGEGGFVVAWNDEPALGFSQGFARRYDAAGSPLGESVPLHGPPGRDPYDVALAVHPDGDAVAVWEDWPVPHRNDQQAMRGTVLRASDPQAVPGPEDFAVAQPFDGSAPFHPAVAIDGEGDAVVAWSQLPDTTRGGIFFRRYHLSPPRDLPARVERVFASSARWTAEFRRALAAQGLGDEALGLAVGGPDPAGWRLHRPRLPWRSVDRIAVRFDDDVVVSADDLKVMGRRFADYPIARAPDGSPAFSYDPATRTATWTLARPLEEDVVTVEVDGDAPRGVTDSAGLPLDGNADAAPGGDFAAAFDALAGDIIPDGVVNALDASYVKQRLNRSLANPGTGPAAYDVFADLDGDGRVNALDLAFIKQRLNRRLPTDGPAATALLFNG